MILFDLFVCQVFFKKIGPFPACFLSSNFQQLTENMLIIKFCRLLDSNRGPLTFEATTLPTEPQALPFVINFVIAL